MKVAICFWGLLRSLNFTFHSIKENIFDVFSRMDIEYDLYVHTYSNHSYYKKSKITIDDKIIYQLNPKIFINEDQFIFDSKIDYKSFQNKGDYKIFYFYCYILFLFNNYIFIVIKGDPWNNNYRSLINSIRALYSLWRTSIALEKSNIKYDFVVFLRPDVMYLNKIPFSFLLKYPDHLLIPDFHRPCSGGKVNDRMAMGNMKNMMVYGKRFEKALNYSKFKKLHSETFLYDVLKLENINFIEVPFRFKRIRRNGLVSSRDDKIISPNDRKSNLTYQKSSWDWFNKWYYKRDINDPSNIFCSPHKRIITIGSDSISRTPPKLINVNFFDYLNYFMVF